MKIDKKRIAIVTTVCNWDLFEKTKVYFPKSIRIFAIDGTKGMYGLNSILFFMKKLKDHKIDWLIMADEDVVFTDSERVFSLIEFLSQNDYTVCGVSEGKRRSNWTKHPYVINTFFGILNLKEIYTIYDEREMLKNQYAIKDEFPKEIEGFGTYDYPMDSLAEPYYCFFLWLLRKGKKTKFLDAINPFDHDFDTSTVFDHEGVPFLYHTWFARFYNRDKYHTERINDIIKKGKAVQTENVEVIRITNKYFNFRFLLYRQWRGLRRKILKKENGK